MNFVIAHTFRSDLDAPVRNSLTPFFMRDVDKTAKVVVFRSEEQAMEIIPEFDSRAEIMSTMSFRCFSDLRAMYPETISIEEVLASL